MIARCARTCFRRRWPTLAAWVVVAVALSVAGAVLADEYRMESSLPGSESQAASDLLVASGFAARSGQTATVVVSSDDVAATPTVRAMDELLAAIAREVPEVGVHGPDDPGGERRISPDGTVAFAELDFGDVDPNEAEALAEEVTAVRDRFEAPEGTAIELGGDLLVEASEFSSEAIGMVAAVVILLIAFGSVLAMGLPIVTALIGITCGVALVGLATNVLDVPDFTPSVVLMIGIGVGIDYALFIVTRYREELHRGADPEDAVVIALDTAGRAVLFAGATVVVSLLGMVVVGLAITQALAVAAASGVLMVMAASLTLLPALLGFVGPHIDRFGLPNRRRAGADDDTGVWYRLSRAVQRRPAAVAVVCLAALVVLAVPVASMRLGFADTGNRPTEDTTRRAYDLIAEGFGPGFNGPLFLAVDLPGDDAADAEVLDRLVVGLDGDDGVAVVLPPAVAPGGTAALVQVFPTTSPQDEATVDLVHRIRRDIAADAVADTDGRVLVGGTVAGAVDLAETQLDRLPVFIATVLVLSFLLLLVTFRSVLVPLKAVLMNLLSIAAAYGVVVAVFQWGWGASLLGVEPGPIEAWVPMMLFAIVFGLSMDYEVFLLSRIRERYEETGDNAAAVADGLAQTARLITAAAAIMVCVFGGFLLSVERPLQLFGLGLAVAVLLDATIVRLLLVPATMELLGDRNWWLPEGLDRILPDLQVEGRGTIGDETVAPAASAPTGR